MNILFIYFIYLHFFRGEIILKYHNLLRNIFVIHELKCQIEYFLISCHHTTNQKYISNVLIYLVISTMYSDHF